MKPSIEIRIGGYFSGSLLLERDPMQWHAIVILDSKAVPTDFVECHAISYRYLHFDDIESPMADKRPPDMTSVAAALEFSEHKTNARLLVCCRAGRGRSVALAYLIGCREYGIDKAVKLLDPTRHRPNGLVVELGAQLLDEPEIFWQFKNWQRCNSHIRLSDYYEELEAEFDRMIAEGGRNRIVKNDDAER